MVTPERARFLSAEALDTRSRADSGRPDTPAPETGSHVAVLVKPEVMTAPHAAATLAEAVGALGRQDVAVLRCAVVPAADFAARGDLFLHYPRLHRVAADGAAALTPDARGALDALRERTDVAQVLAAYEAMAHGGLSPRALEERCRGAGIHKLGSGSYASVTEVNGRPVTVLNGFLPALSEGYRAPDSLVGLLECHSERPVAELRGHVLGELHPLRAHPGSLRGTLGAVAREHGIAVSEGRNAVHLSAGHLEGMFQNWRYFSAKDGDGLDSTPLGRSLAGAGVNLGAVAALAADRDLTDGMGRTLAPHGATEHLDRDEVVRLVGQWVTTAKEWAV
ncbi:hypothetical protein [Streptomyces coffeae]|uniref:Nucleoside diphosphate kinase-like domain-containing protein n=1 Tax=Streptomyces coffeae TaxID=621382 RepID=A0ABS1NDB1_9ACTN|nr:hypothetical protein [Streptomyces coffeae]MBL1097942.1 hypothetical protein [Streptomyces coffeae]